MRRPSPLPPPSDARPEDGGTGAASRPVEPPRTVGPPRRPQPESPQPAAAQPEAPQADRDAVDHPRSDETDARSDETETLPLAPVIPFHLRDEQPTAVTSASDGGPLTRPAAPSAGAPLTGQTLGRPAEPGDEEVGFGHVMRAARARRRALRAEARRFTARQRRRRMAWLGVAGAVLALVLGTLGAAYSPLFAVQTITVEGTGRLDAGAVEEALSGQIGTPMPLVDDSEVKAVLVGFPLVETYSLEARPPHELVVRIVERTPIGVLSSPAGFTLVDAAGVGLSTTSTPPVGEPLIDVDGGAQSDAFEAVGHVVRSLPATIRSQVTQVAATTPNDVTLTLGATGTEIVWGGADQSAMKALALETIMRSRPPETVGAYDVSSPDAIVLR